MLFHTPFVYLLNILIGPDDVQEGLMVDAPNKIQPACTNRTKTDVSFRPSKDVMYDRWTSKGPEPYICWALTRRPFDDCSQMVNLKISLLSSQNFKNIGWSK